MGKSDLMFQRKMRAKGKSLFRRTGENPPYFNREMNRLFLFFNYVYGKSNLITVFYLTIFVLYVWEIKSIKQM